MSRQTEFYPLIESQHQNSRYACKNNITLGIIISRIRNVTNGMFSCVKNVLILIPVFQNVSWRRWYGRSETRLCIGALPGRGYREKLPQETFGNFHQGHDGHL
jgi:hypothetical protein